MVDRPNTKAFREFPPEIREMIYFLALPVAGHDGNQPTTPALLKALRGEPELYAEALHHFYSNNITCVTEKNFRKFEDLNLASWRSIRHLKLMLGYEPHLEFKQFFKDSTSKFRLAENVETLEDEQHWIRLYRIPMTHIVARCAYTSTKLRRVDVSLTCSFPNRLQDVIGP